MKTLMCTGMSTSVLVAGLAIASTAGAQSNAHEHETSMKTVPYSAEYVLSRRGTDRGEASRILEKKDDGTWRYYTGTSASLLVFSDRRHNETIFSLDGDRVVPVSFDYSRRGTGSNRALKVRFDRENKRLVSEGDEEIDIEWRDDLLDPNAVLHQLQIDVAGDGEDWTYPLVDESGDFRDYKFTRVKTEMLNLPYGDVEAVRVDRVRDHERRQTHFWFAPELNYTLVRMQQVEDGREALQIQLTELTIEQ